MKKLELREIVANDERKVMYEEVKQVAHLISRRVHYVEYFYKGFAALGYLDFAACALAQRALFSPF